jgi:hypothetical protein
MGMGVSKRSQVSQNGGGYWNIPDDLGGSKYRKSNWTVSGNGRMNALCIGNLIGQSSEKRK